MKGVQVNTTKDEIELFKASVLWNDIVNELEAWQEGFDREMHSIVDDAEGDNPSTASVLLHMGDLNGRIKAVEYFLSLPDVFMQILEDKKNDTRCKPTD